MRKIALLSFLMVVGAGAAAAVFYVRAQQPYRGYTGAEQFVDIPSGASSAGIGDRLVAGGVIRTVASYRLALWLSGQGRHLKAGEYRFDRPMTPLEVIDKIARGDAFVLSFTFPEGLTMAEMAKIAESHGLGSASTFLDAARDTSLIHDLDSAANNLEGYLFPDTYNVSRKTDAPKLVHLMADRFEHVFTAELREAAAAHQLSVRQAVTLASIVEKETAKAEERPLVAAVYLNRLRIGMPLQCDPTVIYALQRAGTYSGNLRRDDLMFDSPYNTYRYPGLPPGPIASPGRTSLDAAVHPAANADFLYFVSRNDGSHVFAKTLDEHNRNVQKYQVQYFRDRSNGSGGSGGAGRASKRGRPGMKPKE
jgi:UPF0755 protein